MSAHFRLAATSLIAASVLSCFFDTFPILGPANGTKIWYRVYRGIQQESC